MKSIILALLLALSPAYAENPTTDGQQTQTPRGKLVIVGGALWNGQEDIFDALLGSPESRKTLNVAILPAASSRPSYYGNQFMATLIEKGCNPEKIQLLPLAVRDDPSTPDTDESTWLENRFSQQWAEEIRQSDVIWMTGGDQSRIAAILFDGEAEATPIYQALKQFLDEGGTLGGTSAGAAIMSKTMIIGGSSEGALFKGIEENGTVDQESGGLLVGNGGGFFPYGIIDQHFDAKARLGRLVVALAHEPVDIVHGFGIDENTALVVDLTTGLGTVKGSAYVCIVSGRGNPEQKPPYAISGFKISLLGAGDTYCFANDTITPSADKSPTVENAYYHIEEAYSSGALSSYGSLSMLLTRKLIDNAAAQTATTWLFHPNATFAYRIQFTQTAESTGFWCYREGQRDHYTVGHIQLDLESFEAPHLEWGKQDP